MNGVFADIYQQLQITQTIDDFSLIAQYPFSSTRRIEVRPALSIPDRRTLAADRDQRLGAGGPPEHAAARRGGLAHGPIVGAANSPGTGQEAPV